ncbi:MAG: glycoside hydrolase family 2 TIM barrel-domain containing protein, partial [Bryobacteraceae bacterium]
VCWGLCNEIGGQNPPAYDFAKNMLAEAKKLDPSRMCSYASNSLLETPRKDVAALMDFVEFNEYFESWYQGNLPTLSKSLDQIAAEIPNKPIVISEYGYCACTAERPEGDQRRIEILRTHNAVFREKPYIGGLIFFCYNDYRTHIGDRGLGVMKQRVHGVVDVYGNRKPSYEVLRVESSPVESLKVEGHPKEFLVTVTSRKTVPAYRLAGYTMRAVYFGYGEIPIERKEVPIPALEPGQTAALKLSFSAAEPLRVQFDVLRPGGDSAYTREWKA